MCECESVWIFVFVSERERERENASVFSACVSTQSLYVEDLHSHMYQIFMVPNESANNSWDIPALVRITSNATLDVCRLIVSGLMHILLPQ